MAQRRRGGVAYAPGTNVTCEKGMMNAQPLRLIPLGGLGEIGKNMMAIEYGDDILLVDTGLMFPENDMLGIDYIIPDFHYSDREEGPGARHCRHPRSRRPHRRHPPCPGRDQRADLRHAADPRPAGSQAGARRLLQEADLHTIQAGDRVSIGPFKVEFFHVCHSIPDGVGLGIHTPAGLIVHSGDYKFDHTPVDGWPTDYAKLAESGGRGVLALLADSTNADKRRLDSFGAGDRCGLRSGLSPGRWPHHRSPPSPR